MIVNIHSAVHKSIPKVLLKNKAEPIKYKQKFIPKIYLNPYTDEQVDLEEKKEYDACFKFEYGRCVATYPKIDNTVSFLQINIL